MSDATEQRGGGGGASAGSRWVGGAPARGKL